MALLERLEIVIEADARTAEREFDRIGRSAKESLESIETAAGKVGDNASAELAGASSKFAAAGEKLSDAAGKELDLSAAAQRAAADVPRALEGQRSDAEAAGRRLGDSAGEGVASGLRAAGGGVRGAGADLGGDVGDGISGGMVGSLSGIGGELSGALDDVISGLPPGLVGPAGAAAAVVGAAFVTGFADAIESENLGDVIAARVGAGAAESEQFARVSAGVFRDAWGDSTAEVSQAVDAVYSTLADAKGSEATLQDLTTRAQAFADVFEQDVGSAVSNAGVLIETGLARDAVDAFDLMTRAAQGVPAAMRDELGEATQEYSTFFGALGYDGQEAFGILVDAAGEGRYELDKTGDAIKELTIRATDLADVAAMSALEDLGLDARDTANRLLEGGEAARVATQQIFDALSTVPEPARQAEIAIALMGAPLEDLNKAEIPEFVARLADASDGMEDATGASDELTSSLKNTSSAVSTVKRELLGAFEDYANDVLQPLADYLNSDDPTLKDAANSAGEFLGRSLVDAMYLTIGGPLSLFFDLPGKQEIKDMLGVGDDEPIEVGVEVGFKGGDPGLQLDPATGQLIPDSETNVDVKVGFKGGDPGLQLDPATGQLVPDSETKVEVDASQAVASLEDVNREIALSNDLFALAGDRADNYLTRIENTSSLDNLIDSQLALRDATGELLDGLGALQGVDIEGFAAGTVAVSDEAAEALGDIGGAASAAQQQIADALEFQGAEAAYAKSNELRVQFAAMFREAGLGEQQVNDLLFAMGLMPEQVTTAIELSGADEALAKLDLLQTRFAEDVPDKVQTQIDIAIAEGRFVDAANLISLWVQDQEDGSIDDPLLLQIMGETAPAQEAVDGVITENTGREIWLTLRANVDKLAGDFPIFGTPGASNGGGSTSDPTDSWGDFNPPTAYWTPPGRATGGPVMADTMYQVNEMGGELFAPSTPGFVMTAGETQALIQGVQALLNGAGGSGMTVNQTVIAPDPMVAASESARQLRQVA